MGLLDDLQMGLGLKDRNKDYYKRTAKTIRNSRGDMAADRYMERMKKSNFPKRGGLLSGMNVGEYRDINDMFDGGGPMARGGQYEGGGLISFLGNLANALIGRDMGASVGYGAPTQATVKPKARPMPRQTPVTGYFPDMAMMAIEGMGEPTTNPFAVGGGMDNILNDAFPIADVASPLNTAKTTAAQDELLSMAQNLVASENPSYNSTMPREEKMARVQQKYNELAISLGM